MYARLRRLSTLTLNASSATECARPLHLIDKAPAYVYQLEEIMDKTPNIPVVVTTKEFEALETSWKKRGVAVLTRHLYDTVEAEIQKQISRTFVGRAPL